MDPNWYVGKGKAEELAQARSETGFDVLVADDELSPAQQKSLESLLNVKVIDRSRLILDIFALHAQTHEGRLQVELAQLEYQLPRLTRLWTHLSRTGGGIGTRGPGESQLETDRRLIRERIKKMKVRVEDVRRQRETTARGRDRRLYPTVAIVGYTNAGKSTLLNALVGSEVAKAEDKLFATLDPTSRQVKLGDGQTAIVTDTVGFIHKLPRTPATCSGPRSRRSPGPTCWSRSSTRPMATRQSTGPPSRPCSTPGQATSHASRRSTRRTCCIRARTGRSRRRPCQARSWCPRRPGSDWTRCAPRSRRSWRPSRRTWTSPSRTRRVSCWHACGSGGPSTSSSTASAMCGSRDGCPRARESLRSAADRWEASLAEGVAP